MSEWLLDIVIMPSYGLPKVKATKRIDDWQDAYNFVLGAKDGMVAITGSDSKATLCNGNITVAQEIWWDNWTPFYYERETKFNTENWNGSFTLMSDYTG